jgi:uncharacterized protein YegP (UPF0339 family)
MSEANGDFTPEAVEFFTDPDGQFRFHVRNSRGDVIVTSEGFARESTARRALAATQAALAEPDPELTNPVLIAAAEPLAAALVRELSARGMLPLAFAEQVGMIEE